MTDLVDDRYQDLLDDLGLGVAQRADGLAVHRDAIGQSQSPVVLSLGERDSLVETQQVAVLAEVFDDHSQVVDEATELGRDGVQRLADQRLEAGQGHLDHTAESTRASRGWADPGDSPSLALTTLASMDAEPGSSGEDDRASHQIGRLLSGLNEAQHQAVTSNAAPLCILAGAGTGKTRVLTRRIARRVLADEIDPRRVLAVTFTRKAASELKDRLRQLGLRDSVHAGTFHSIAYAQVRQRWNELGVRPPELLDRKVGFVAQLLRTTDKVLPLDVVNEIEWAKATRVPAERYAEVAGRAGRRPPLDAQELADVYRRYEEEKLARRLVDFDDLLRLAIRDLSSDKEFAAARRWYLRHLFVDEFQDVNPLQFSLLRAWLGASSDLCVVGDPNQAIYGWNGADAGYLEHFEQHFPGGHTVDLSENYRSTPQILATANATLAAAGIPRITLRANAPDGPVPTIRECSDDRDEAAAVARAVRDSHSPATPWSHQAVLVRTNAQIPLLEQALRTTGIPCRSRGSGAFLDAPEVKEALRLLKRSRANFDVALADLQTWADEAISAAPGEAAALVNPERAANVEELVRLAGEYRSLDPDAATSGFLAWLRSTMYRDSADSAGDAVDIATFHSAKGLEWSIVHIAGVEDGLVPIGHARTSAARLEERRLFYVALTRAQRQLSCSWSRRRTFGTRTTERAPSPYLESVREAIDLCRLGQTPADWHDHLLRQREQLGGSVKGRSPRGGPELTPAERKLLDALKRWRLTSARAANVPAYVIFNDATLEAVVRSRPRNQTQLLELPGIGAVKAHRFGPELLRIVAEH